MKNSGSLRIVLLVLSGSWCVGAPSPAAAQKQPYPANSPGMERASAQIIAGPIGVYHPQYTPRSTLPDVTLDLRQTILWGNEGSPYSDERPLAVLPEALPERGDRSSHELYPMNAAPVSDGFWFVGGTVVGRQHRDLPWTFMKRLFDGDGLRFEAARGATVTVHGLRVDNMEDGVSPRLAPGAPHEGAYWRVRQCYFRYIRDDVVENDALMSGEITDCLVDGAFMFLSQRPGARSPIKRANAIAKVQGCVVHLQRMPYEKDLGGHPAAAGSLVDGKGHGQLFKFKGTDSGKLEVRDSVFLIDGLSVNGPRSMTFPTWEGCVYENVTIVWRGGGRYPGELPARGVTVTDDLVVWQRARDAWLASHPGATDGM